MSYSTSLRGLQEWLRGRLRRDSGSWRIAFATKSLARRIETMIMTGRWERATRRFESLLAAKSDGTPDFFFVQVGAHDGEMDDPIADWITTRGWRGLFVEPQPEQFARLRERHELRNELFIFENVAIDRVPRTRSLYCVANAHKQDPVISGLASFFPDRALATHAALGRLTCFEADCVPLQALIDKHQIGRIDLLQIDAEGFDAVVIETLDLNRARPAMIRYEHRHLTRNEQAACLRRLHRHGYHTSCGRFDAFAWIEPA